MKEGRLKKRRECKNKAEMREEVMKRYEEIKRERT